MKLVILDRDGVINENSDEYVKTPEEWRPIPGSLEAIAKLYQAGWRVMIASNQSALGRGLMSLESLSQIHRKMDIALGALGARIDGFFFCPHAPAAGCRCRKPRPGLLKNIGKRLNVDLTGVPFIGDSKKDLDAAKAVKARPMLVLTGNGQATASAQRLPKGVQTYPNLLTVAGHLLELK